jgi:hypothetical protein
MKNMLFLILLCFTIVSCNKETTETTSMYELPDGLKDCKIYRMEAQKGTTLRVVRCPNSETSTKHSCGKNCNSNTIVL